MENGGAVYILTNKNHTTLYVGVTSDLYVRIIEYRERISSKSFTARYNVMKLVFFETFHSIEEAIAREKQFKGGSRQKKIDAINEVNPEWEDLFTEVSKW
ncbi:MAG: GIY-YIG nuclease family protein [Cytophagales bacterium]|nr:GIY-YIG nuclease family protein [Cytophagales bacterium]